MSCRQPWVMAVLLLLLAAAAFLPGGHTKSTLDLYNSSVTVAAGQCEEPPALSGVLATAGLQGLGLEERQAFAQAYLCPSDPLSLCNPLAVLESAATIQANNSYIGLNTTAAPTGLRSLGLQEVQNNTLTFADADVTIDRSTLTFGSWNWFNVVNSTVFLHYSRLNISDWFAWYVANSRFISNYSVIEQKDVNVLFSDSTVELNDLTWYVWSDRSTPAPGNFANYNLTPTVWIDRSNVIIRGSQVIFENVSDIHVTNGTTLSLLNTTLQLWGGAKLVLWGSTLRLEGSSVQLYEGSTIELLCNSTIIGDNNVTWAGINNVSTQLITGTLGATDLAVVQVPNANIVLEHPGGGVDNYTAPESSETGAYPPPFSYAMVPGFLTLPENLTTPAENLTANNTELVTIPGAVAIPVENVTGATAGTENATAAAPEAGAANQTISIGPTGAEPSPAAAAAVGGEPPAAPPAANETAAAAAPTPAAAETPAAPTGTEPAASNLAGPASPTGVSETLPNATAPAVPASITPIPAPAPAPAAPSPAPAPVGGGGGQGGGGRPAGVSAPPQGVGARRNESEPFLTGTARAGQAQAARGG